MHKVITSIVVFVLQGWIELLFHCLPWYALNLQNEVYLSNVISLWFHCVPHVSLQAYSHFLGISMTWDMVKHRMPWVCSIHPSMPWHLLSIPTLRLSKRFQLGLFLLQVPWQKQVLLHNGWQIWKRCIQQLNDCKICKSFQCLFVWLACLLAPRFFAAPSEASPGVVANGQCLANWGWNLEKTTGMTGPLSTWFQSHVGS